jgi:putative SOS response-associated peptidase YedK
MCGRYTLTLDQEALQVALGVEVLLQVHPRPRFNIAPSQKAPVVLREPDGDGPPVVRALRWGLVPGWARDPTVGNRLINARSETVASKPSFREAFRARRALVPADGFYEWSTGLPRTPGAPEPAPRPRTPWLIHRPERELFTFAGLWEWAQPPGSEAPLHTFTLLTAPAAGAMAGLHHRMPVVVHPLLRRAWLEAEDGEEVLAAVLDQAVGEGEAMTADPVSTRVNTPAHDDPELVVSVDPPPPEPEQGSLFG